VFVRVDIVTCDAGRLQVLGRGCAGRGMPSHLLQLSGSSGSRINVCIQWTEWGKDNQQFVSVSLQKQAVSCVTYF
jgi:hypothetical protein